MVRGGFDAFGLLCMVFTPFDCMPLDGFVLFLDGCLKFLMIFKPLKTIKNHPKTTRRTKTYHKTKTPITRPITKCVLIIFTFCLDSYAIFRGKYFWAPGSRPPALPKAPLVAPVGAWTAKIAEICSFLMVFEWFFMDFDGFYVAFDVFDVFCDV